MKRKKILKKQLSEKQIRNSNKGRICFIQGTIQYILTSAAIGLSEKEKESLNNIITECEQILIDWK